LGAVDGTAVLSLAGMESQPHSLDGVGQQFSTTIAGEQTVTGSQADGQTTVGVHVDSQTGVAHSTDGAQWDRWSMRSIHFPAITGLNVTNVERVTTVASRTQYVNGLDMDHYS
jgi:hypothetical protein